MEKLATAAGKIIILAIVFPTLACGGTIGFESVPDGTLLTNQIPGVLFTNAVVLGAGLSLNEFEFPPHSGANVASDWGGPLSIGFDGPINGFSAYFTYLAPLQVAAYDASGHEMATAMSRFGANLLLSGDPGSASNELIQISTPGISKILVTGFLDGSSFTMDDISTAEPSSSFLVLAGLLFSVLTRVRVARPRSSYGLAALVCVMVFAEQSSGQAFDIPTAEPSAINIGTSKRVTIAVAIVGTNIIRNSVNVQRLNAQGQPLSTVGTLNDDGVDGDSAANDGVYAGTVNLSATEVGAITLRISAGVLGSLVRVFSSPVRVEVLPEDIPSGPAVSDMAQTVTDAQTGSPILGNEVLVCFQANSTFDQIRRAATLISGALKGRLSDLGQCYQFGLALTNAAAVRSAIAMLRTLPSIVSVGPNYVVSGQQGVTCFTCETTSFKDVLRLDKARALSTGRGIRVAILDGGIDLLFQKQDFPRLSLGSDQSGEDSVIVPEDCAITTPECVHGTMVAGIVRAVAPESLLHIIRVIDRKGHGSTSGVIRAIFEAAHSRARIINLSVRAKGSSIPAEELQVFAMAIDAARQRDIVVVAGAGNDTSDESAYPAAFNSVLSVGGTEDNDVRYAPSNFGAWVKLAAPARTVSNGVPADKGWAGDGTSFSAPLVSGTAALLRSTRPDWSAQQGIDWLERSAVQLPVALQLGFGRLNPVQRFSLTVKGPGQVLFPDQVGVTVTCTPSSCDDHWFIGRDAMKLSARPDSGYGVTWGSDCGSGGTSSSPQFELTRDMSCTASFTPLPAISGTVRPSEWRMQSLARVKIQLRDETPSCLGPTWPDACPVIAVTETDLDGRYTFEVPGNTTGFYITSPVLAPSEISQPKFWDSRPGAAIPDFLITGHRATVNVSGAGKNGLAVISDFEVGPGLPTWTPASNFWSATADARGNASVEIYVGRQYWVTCYIGPLWTPDTITRSLPLPLLDPPLKVGDTIAAGCPPLRQGGQ